MREISLDGPRAVFPTDTFMLYGDTGAGKTTWSGGLPRPLFLSVNDEGGHESLRGYPTEWLFEPTVKPRVWAISEMNDMAVAVNQLRPLIEAKQVMSVIVSSLTFYSDLYLAKLIEAAPGTDTRQIYGALGTHLRDLRVKIHSLGVNVVWEALTDHPEASAEGKQGHSGRPLIPGKQADKFAAGVGYVMRAVLEEKREDGKVAKQIFKQYTQTYGGYIARPRIAPGLPSLPNPLVGGYPAFLAARGYDIAQLRKAMPPMRSVTATVAVAAKPPVLAQPKPVATPAAQPRPVAQPRSTTTAPINSASTTVVAPRVVTPSGAKPTTTK